MKIEFYYTVSCGLDGFFIHFPNMPTEEEAFKMVMDHCVKCSIDPYFAFWAIAWYEWGPNPDCIFKFDDDFKKSKTEEVATYSKLMKENSPKRRNPFS